MRGAGVAAACIALALLTFFQFPGHTWLQQDTQIYAPILEHLRDSSLFRNDPLAQHPHVAYTLYDEAARALRGITGLGFREVLEAQQIATRALGIWGLFLLAESFGLAAWPALAAAAICSLGAFVAGPSVLTFEYEPTPRAFAVPLIFCAMGLAAHRRWMAASLAGAAAFLYHPPTTLPFWAVFGVMLIWRRRWRELAVPAAAALLLLLAARMQGDGNAPPFARLGPLDEQLQRFRTAYVWISMWPPSRIVHEVVLFAVGAAAFWRVRAKASAEGAVLLATLPVIGILSMPASWLLLERMKWSLVPQLQPMRALLFVAIAVQLLAAVAALRANSRLEAFAWFVVAFLVPVLPVIGDSWPLRATMVALACAVICAVGQVPRLAAGPQAGVRPGGTWASRADLGVCPTTVLFAFFLFPTVGGVVNYPRLHTPELAELSTWARSSTPKDSVFLFPDVPRSLDPGIFRAEALRAVYVDWKSGGQVNYLSDFAGQWWFRWQQTLARPFHPAESPRYSGLGIRYLVVQPRNGLQEAPVFANSTYLVYRVH
jgi:hypothetical protein